METDEMARLRDLIQHSRAQGIDRLPPEPKLSVVLDVSRGRLRTLLRKIEEEGLIWRHVGKGTFIGSRQTTDGGDVAQSVSVDQTMNARMALEPQLAAQAAMHATSSDFAELDSVVEKMAQTTTFEDWKRLDDELHCAIATATHNPLLILLHDTLKQGISRHLTMRLASVFFGPLETSEARERTEREHRVVVDAIKAHDPEAAERLMLTHIGSVRARLFGGR